jgi:C4-dicarboxylate-specific signal transduction histidine kinase
MNETVVTLAPGGRNQAVINEILTAGGFDCRNAAPEVLVDGLGKGHFATAVLTEEALHLLPIADLQNALAAQEAWSDFPFVVLVSKGDLSPATAAIIEALGNVAQVERPMRRGTLFGAVRSALRARQRQREARHFISAHADAECQLRVLAESLEARVLDRTRALSETNRRLKYEMAARREATDRMDAMQAELIHISRVSAMGAMASTLAHELNQPLAAVMNYVVASRHLLETAPEPAPQRILAALDAAATNANEAAEIVRRLRDLVARGEVKRQREDLPALIEDALRLGLIDASSSGVECRLLLDVDASSVLVDKVQIQQVLVNLIRNSVEAMQYSPIKVIRINARRLDNKLIEVTVSDTGPGIDAAILAAIFSPFNTSKRDGLGIGLSISRTIIEANGGSITGANGRDGGAIMRFTLPRALGVHRDADTTSSMAPSPAKRRHFLATAAPGNLAN